MATPASKFAAIPLINNFASALRKHAMYTSGHPILNETLTTLRAQFNRFFETWPSLVVGIGRDSLFMEGDEVGGEKWIESLAQMLHRRSISQLTFFRGLTFRELELFFEILELDPLVVRNAGGYQKYFTLKGISAIEVLEIDYHIHEGDIDFQLNTLSDAQVWHLISKRWQSGSRKLTDEDLKFAGGLLKDAARLAALLNSAISEDRRTKETSTPEIFLDMTDQLISV